MYKMEKNIEIVGNKDKSNIVSALLTQDKLRAKVGKWQGSEEIQKWRLRQN
jgi:hypothetical protein